MARKRALNAVLVVVVVGDDRFVAVGKCEC